MIGGGFAHQGDQRGFKLCGLRQPLLRMTFDGDMDKDRDRHVVAGNPERSRSANALLSSTASQSADPRQLIGGNALIGGRVHQMTMSIRSCLRRLPGDRGPARIASASSRCGS